MRVLVTAASRHGSTAEIARAIRDELETAGLSATLAAPEDLGSLAGFDAVVLGSALYAGHWLPLAVGLAERIGSELPGRPVWLFSSGPVGDPAGRAARQMAADPIELPRALEASGARGHQLFAGKLDRKSLSGLQRVALFAFRSLEGDFRDWAAIAGWARSIAAELAGLTPERDSKGPPEGPPQPESFSRTPHHTPER